MISRFFTLGGLFLLSLQASRADVEVFKSIQGGLTEVEAGEPFTYKLQYRAASTTTDFFGATLTDVIPAELDFLSLNGTVHVDRFTHDPGTNTLTVHFVDPLPAGSTGDIEVQVRFTPGTTPDGTEAVNTATINATNSPASTTPPVTITARAANTAFVRKTLLGSSIPLDQNVTYRVELFNQDTVGGLLLEDAVLVDSLPPEAEFIAASNAGVYDPGAHTVTWPAQDLNVGGSLRRTVTVKYPAASFTLGEEVTNGVTVTYTPLGGTEATDTDSVTHTIVAPSGSHRFVKSVSNSYVYEGKEVNKTWSFDVRNQGNVPMENVVVTDVIPPELRVYRIRTGRMSGTPSGLENDIQVFFKTTSNSSWSPLPGNPYSGSSSSWVNVSALGLAPSEDITEVKWELGTLPVGYRVRDHQIATTVLTLDRNGDPVVEGDEIRNDGALAYTDYRGPITDTDDDDLDVRSPRPVVNLSKNASPTTVDDGGSTSYELVLRNDSLAARDLINPVLADLLHSKLVYSPGSATVTHKPAGAPDPILEVIEDYKGTGRTLLRWSWTGASAYDLPIGQEIRLAFDVDVPRGTVYGSIPNQVALVDFDNTVVDRRSTGTVTDTFDLDDDGNTAETFPMEDRNITVRSRASMDSVKWVKGELDSDWSKYPDSGRTVPGGKADYRLIVENTGNVPIHDAVVLDILPIIGDTGVIDLSQRDTEWKAALAGPVTAPPGVTVYYSRSADPRRLDFDPDGPAGAEDPEWSTTPPATITDARSLKFVFNGVVIQPGEEFELSWPMRAPVETPTDGEIAWNSFGYYGTREDTGTELLPSEPIKVGIAVEPDYNAAYGDRVWLDVNKNGIQDDGEVGLNGIPVKLYQDSGPGGFPDGVRNPGEDPLISFTVTSDAFTGEPGYYLFPDLEDQGLNRGDYYAVFELPDTYEVSPMNQGGDDAKDSDLEVATSSMPITRLDAGEKDRSWDVGLSLPPYSVSIVKTAGTAADGDVYWSDPGAPVTYTYVITNTGTLPLVRLRVSDDKLGQVALLDGPLEPGESTTVTKASGPLSAGVVNIGDVSAYPADPTTKLEIAGAPPVTDDDPAEVRLYASIGNKVWLDEDLDGEQDSGEPGVSGVEVTLRNGAGDVVATTTTNGNGWYRFSDLFPGDYSVEVEQPAGYLFTTQDAGGNDATDSDVDPSTGNMILTTLDEGEEDMSWDAGLWESASLGDYVWWDYDADGLQDSGEVGLNGVTVHLLTEAGTPVMDGGSPVTAVTADGPGGAGYYRFDGLTPGVPYRVRFEPASGMELTVQDADSAGLNGGSNSDADPTTGVTGSVTLANGEYNPRIDAGVKSNPEIQIIKNVDKSEYRVDGETLSYTFTVTNTGNVPLNNVVVTDPLFQVQGGPISLAVGEVDSTTFHGTYNVDLDDLNAGERPNTARVEGTFTPTGEVVSDEDDVTVPAVQLPEITLEKTGTFRVGSGPCSTLGLAAGFNAMIFGNFDASGGDTEGRLAVAGTLSIAEGYSVNIAVKGEHVPTVFGSGTDSMIVGGNLNDGVFGVNGNIVYGGVRTGDTRYMPNGNLLRQVVPVTLDAGGNVPGDGSGVSFEDLLADMEIRSALFAAIPDRGVSVKGMTSPHELSLIGTDPDLNVFNLTHDEWSLSQSDIVISAPADSTVLVNVHGGPVAVGPGAMRLSGVTANDILVNLVNAEEVEHTSFLLEASLLAPYAHATFTGGGIDGTAVIGGNVTSSQGFEFHNYPFRGQICLEVFYEFTVANIGNVTVEDIRIDDPLVTVVGGPIALDPGASDSSTFTGVLKIEPSHVVDGRIVNTAEASGQPPLGKPRVTAGASDEQSFTIPGIGSGGRTPPAAPVAPPPADPTPEPWQKADFTVEFVKFKNLNPVPGDKFHAVVRVTNTGHVAGDAGYLKGWAHQAGAADSALAAEKSIRIGVLNPGQSRKMRLRKLRVPADAGYGEQNLQFRAYVDATGTEEYSTGDNQIVEGYAVQYPESDGTPAGWMKPDFEVQSVELLPSPTMTSAKFSVRVRIKNVGYVAGDAGTLSFWQASPSYTDLPGSADQTVAVGSLAVDEVKEITFSNLTAPAAQGTFHTRVRVDQADAVEEMSEGNNDGGATYTVFPLSITIVATPAGNEISWNGAAGFRYTVERSTGLNGDFLPIAENLPAVLPETKFLDDAVPSGSPVFYRVWGIR